MIIPNKPQTKQEVDPNHEDSEVGKVFFQNKATLSRGAKIIIY